MDENKVEMVADTSDHKTNNENTRNEIEAAADSSANSPPLSKNQQKRAARYEKFLKNRPLKRAAERARLKEKRLRLREAGPSELCKKPLLHDMATSGCPISVAIDMSYEEKMSDSFMRKTFTQLNYAYAANRRSQSPLQYHIAHLNGRTKAMFDECPGYKEWDVFQHQESIVELWPPERIVYLTADSPNTIDQLDRNKIYVIGGLLDRNQYPGLSLARANYMRTGHARLPIDEHVKLHTRKILTINQVFEIILRFYETNDWERAFFAVIPKRKGIEKRESLIVSASRPASVLPIAEPIEDVVEIAESQPVLSAHESNSQDVIVIDDEEPAYVTID